MDKAEENIIIVSHGDTLSALNSMWLGFEPEMLNQCDLFGWQGEYHFLTKGGIKSTELEN